MPHRFAFQFFYLTSQPETNKNRKNETNHLRKTPPPGNREKPPGKQGETAGLSGRNPWGLWVSAAAGTKSTAR